MEGKEKQHQPKGGLETHHNPPLGGAASSPRPFTWCDTCCLVGICQCVAIDVFNSFRRRERMKRWRHKHPKEKGWLHSKVGNNEPPSPRRKRRKQHHSKREEVRKQHHSRGELSTIPKGGWRKQDHRKQHRPQREMEEQSNTTQKVDGTQTALLLIQHVCLAGCASANVEKNRYCT